MRRNGIYFLEGLLGCLGVGFTELPPAEIGLAMSSSFEHLVSESQG